MKLFLFIFTLVISISVLADKWDDFESHMDSTFTTFDNTVKTKLSTFNSHMQGSFDAWDSNLNSTLDGFEKSIDSSASIFGVSLKRSQDKYKPKLDDLSSRGQDTTSLMQEYKDSILSSKETYTSSLQSYVVDLKTDLKTDLGQGYDSTVDSLYNDLKTSIRSSSDDLQTGIDTNVAILEDAINTESSSNVLTNDNPNVRIFFPQYCTSNQYEIFNGPWAGEFVYDTYEYQQSHPDLSNFLLGVAYIDAPPGYSFSYRYVKRGDLNSWWSADLYEYYGYWSTRFDQSQWTWLPALVSNSATFEIHDFSPYWRPLFYIKMYKSDTGEVVANSNQDSDGDGISDADEINQGSDPDDPNDYSADDSSPDSPVVVGGITFPEAPSLPAMGPVSTLVSQLNSSYIPSFDIDMSAVGLGVLTYDFGSEPVMLVRNIVRSFFGGILVVFMVIISSKLIMKFIE